MLSSKEWLTSRVWGLTAIEDNTAHAVELLQPLLSRIREMANKNHRGYLLTPLKLWLAVKSLIPSGSVHLPLTGALELKIAPLDPATFHTRKALQGPLGNEIELLRAERGLCDVVHGTKLPMIFSDGSVVPCSVDDTGELVMGKVSETTTLSSILQGPVYQKFIADMTAGKLTHLLCRECLGELRYRDPFRRALYAISSFNILAWGRGVTGSARAMIKKVLIRIFQ